MNVNIKVVNVDGVHELLTIGTALKNAQAYITENGGSSKELQIDKAIEIIDAIVAEDSTTA